MVFSKICIICSNEFFTVRSNTLYCSKKCRNRVRYLPQQIVNSLVKRNAQFTMKANKFTASIQGRTIETLPADIQLCEAKARDEARRRGIKVSSIVDDNLDYINTTDPALGDSTGFGIKPDNITEQEIETEQEDNKISSSTHQELSTNKGKGIRKLGSLK